MRNLFFAISISILSLLIVSCQEEEFTYSCNPEIDVWVKKNLPEIKEMTRSEWLELDEDYKRPVLVGFSVRQKQQFWTEKIKEALNLEWNKEEQEHIYSLLSVINNNPLWFDPDYLKSHSEEYDNILMFFYKWEDYGKEKLNWDNKICYALIGTGNTVVNTKGDFIVNENKLINIKTRSEYYSCNCNRWSSPTLDCWHDVYWDARCQTTSCRETAGCGPLYIMACNGTCFFY